MQNKPTEFPADRYQRQSLLPQIGKAGQAKLASARVLLVGCGALGTVVADLLVRAGVGFLRIVDRDLVELTNLQRQVLFDETDASQETPKAIAAARRLAKINSSVIVEPIVADLNAANIKSLAGLEENGPKVNLILDGTDNVATRYLINDLAVQNAIPWIYAGCVGVSGRVMAIRPGKTACLRCLFPDPPKADELPTCDLAGVLGPAAAAVASIQAGLAMRILVDDPQPLPGLLTIDLWNTQFRELASYTPQTDCPCCGQRQFSFLSTTGHDFTTTLCGRNAVQVSRPHGSAAINLTLAASRLAEAGQIEQTKYFLRCRLNDPSAISLTLFPDGRLMVHGTTDMGRARSLYARYIGT